MSREVRGPAIEMIWRDELQLWSDAMFEMFFGVSREQLAEERRKRRELEEITAHWAQTGRSGHRWVFSGGRGHGKVHRMREFLRWQKEVSVVRDAPRRIAVHRLDIRWSCQKPTINVNCPE
jgi:hypothetical protein